MTDQGDRLEADDEENPKSKFPCPCGRKQRNECQGLFCAEEGTCVECGARAMGSLNKVRFCENHSESVMHRVMLPSLVLLHGLLEEEKP